MRSMLIAFFLLNFLVPGYAWGGCSEAEALGFDCYRNTLRAIRESSPKAIREYAKRAEKSADKALTEAQECACYETREAFRSAFLSARSAVKAKDLETCRKYLRQTLRAAKEGTKTAERCR